MKLVLVRGGGDLASGVALRLFRAGFQPVMAELPSPMAVRRTVSFSEAVYEGCMVVEGVTACRANSSSNAFELAQAGLIPVVIDPHIEILTNADFLSVVDARLLKIPQPGQVSMVPLVIGLGPGFTCGQNCHAVVETQRGHFLGRVYWNGSASPDTGTPEGDPRRVLRAPCSGTLTAFARIGEHLEKGQPVGEIDNQIFNAPFDGVLRGLIRPGILVQAGVKIGDIDPRDDPAYCFTVSDKALAVGGGVLEAILSSPDRR